MYVGLIAFIFIYGVVTKSVSSGMFAFIFFLTIAGIAGYVPYWKSFDITLWEEGISTGGGDNPLKSIEWKDMQNIYKYRMLYTDWIKIESKDKNKAISIPFYVEYSDEFLIQIKEIIGDDHLVYKNLRKTINEE